MTLLILQNNNDCYEIIYHIIIFKFSKKFVIIIIEKIKEYIKRKGKVIAAKQLSRNHIASQERK